MSLVCLSSANCLRAFLCIIFRRGFLLGRQPCRPIWCRPIDATKQRNALQMEKNACKLRKQLLSIWQHTRCKCSLHNQTKKCTANKMYLVVLWAFTVCYSLYLFVLWLICTTCCQTDEDVFLICWCFFYLHVFSEVAARWALSATVPYSKRTKTHKDTGQTNIYSNQKDKNDRSCPCFCHKIKFYYVRKAYTLSLPHRQFAHTLT